MELGQAKKHYTDFSGQLWDAHQESGALAFASL